MSLTTPQARQAGLGLSAVRRIDGIGRSMKTLEQLYRDHDGKVSDKWSLYLTEYERFLSPYRDRPIRILEIGVQNGGSLEIWGKYFEEAEKIVGCDLNPDCAGLHYDDARISVVIGNANAGKTRRQILKCSSSYDIIIDDGSHRSKDVIRSFDAYFPCLSEGGLYVVEDLHCSYWEEFSGGLYHPGSSIAFFKLLVDIVNREHWGVDKARSELLLNFEKCYEIQFGESLLREIHSIEFVNSLCVIRKRSEQKNLLGPRFVAGVTEAVAPMRSANGGASAQTDQRGNKWAFPRNASEADLLRTEMSAQAALANRDAALYEFKKRLEIASAELSDTKAGLAAQQADAAQQCSVLEGRLTEAESAVAQQRANLEARLADAEKFAAQERANLEAKLAETVRAAAQQRADLERNVAEAGSSAAQQRADLEARLAETERSAAQQRSDLQGRLADTEKSAAQRRANLEARLAETERSAAQQRADLERRLAETERSAAQQRTDLERRLAETERSAAQQYTDLEGRLAETEESAAQQCADLKSRLAEARQQLQSTAAQLATARNDHQAALHDVRRDMASTTAQLDSTKAQLDAVEARLAESTAELARQNDDAVRERRELEVRRAASQARAIAAEARHESLQAEHDGVLNSTFWRATAPARRFAAVLPQGARRQARRGLRLLYWASTPHRTAARIARLRARGESMEKSSAPAWAVLFDRDWYLERYPDVAAGADKGDPIRHFIHHGASERRDPNPFFNTISSMAPPKAETPARCSIRRGIWSRTETSPRRAQIRCFTT